MTSPERMHYRRYYVVEVSHFPGNPVYRAIVECVDEKSQRMRFFTYDEFLEVPASRLNHFAIVSEIEDMAPPY